MAFEPRIVSAARAQGLKCAWAARAELHCFALGTLPKVKPHKLLALFMHGQSPVFFNCAQSFALE